MITKKLLVCMIILYVIIRIILIVIIVGAMGAFAINSMLNPISDKEREEIRKEGCMGTSCDMKKLVLLIHDKINEERKQYGLKELRWDTNLALIAEKHSKDMGQRDYYDHVTPEGLDPTDRANRDGYSCKKEYGTYYTYGVAENLYQLSGPWGGYENISSNVVEGWMDSSGHRENILEKNYDRQGIGVFFDPATSGDPWGWYITQKFC